MPFSAYVGTNTYPAYVARINLTSFSETSSIQLNEGENALATAVADTASGLAFFGCSTLIGVIVEMQLTGTTLLLFCPNA
jgi:hypothetical protein